MREESHCLHPLTDDHRAFIRTIAGDEDDRLPRLVYADWLDEHGEEDEATRQRAWHDARAWLEEFAGEAGLTYEEAIEGGRIAVADPSDYFTQRGSDAARGEMWVDETKARYWANWSIVTGVRVTDAQKGHTVFSCSC